MSKKALVLLAMAADDAKVRLAAGWKAQGEAKTESGVDLRLENMARGRRMVWIRISGMPFRGRVATRCAVLVSASHQGSQHLPAERVPSIDGAVVGEDRGQSMEKIILDAIYVQILVIDDDDHG
jgi:hypothetical protein